MAFLVSNTSAYWREISEGSLILYKKSNNSSSLHLHLYESLKCSPKYSAYIAYAKYTKF